MPGSQGCNLLRKLASPLEKRRKERSKKEEEKGGRKEREEGGREKRGRSGE